MILKLIIMSLLFTDLYMSDPWINCPIDSPCIVNGFYVYELNPLAVNNHENIRASLPAITHFAMSSKTLTYGLIAIETYTIYNNNKLREILYGKGKGKFYGIAFYFRF